MSKKKLKFMFPVMNTKSKINKVREKEVKYDLQ